MSAPDKLLLVAQDTGYFHMIKIEDAPESHISEGFFNPLSMIYKMEKLPNEAEAGDYWFMVGTNNGIAIVNVNKTTY